MTMQNESTFHNMQGLHITESIQDFIDRHPSRTDAAKALDTNLVQLKRWENAGCIVMGGQVWRLVSRQTV